jgi:hypothetical protein
VSSEDDPLYAVWGFTPEGELYMTFFREAPEIVVATPAEVELDEAVARRLAYWKWRQAHGHGEFDIEWKGWY